jgi:hypothetical protein
MINILKLLSDKFENIFSFVENEQLIEVFYNLEHILSINIISENQVIILTSKDYKSEKNFKYVQIIAEILKKENIKVMFKQKKITLITKLKKLLTRDDVNQINHSILHKCKFSERYFYNILRPNSKQYRYGILIYFEKTLIGVFKMYNDKTFLSLNRDYAKMVILDLPQLIKDIILENISLDYISKKNDWVKINLVGDRIPINFSESNNETRDINNFEELKKKKIFLEVYNESDETIYNEFLKLVDNCFNENKDFKGRYDIELDLEKLCY